MPMTSDQELRKELLFKALETYPDLTAAFQAVTLMERFIIEGAEPDSEQDAKDTEPAPADPSTSVGPALADITQQGHPRTRRAGRWCRWQPEDDTLLRQLWEGGRPVEKIAAELGRTQPSIYGRARQLGLERQKRRSHPEPSAAQGSCETTGRVEWKSTNGGASEQTSPLNYNLLKSKNKKTVEIVSIEEVVRFLRSRDYSIVRTQDGRFQLDGRRLMTSRQLFTHANKVREQIGKPRWPGTLPLSSIAS